MLCSFGCRTFIEQAVGIGMVLCVLACRPGNAPKLARVAHIEVDAGKDQALSAHHGRGPSLVSREPRLLPLLTHLDPSNVAVPRPGTVDLIVDGIRLRVTARGTFELGRGVLPISRQIDVRELPVRLGGGVLFSLASSEDTWLMRADSFVGDLQPVATLDVPTRSVVVGFEALYATIKSSGLVVAIDPRSGAATRDSFLPPAPEYGAIRIVDDWFGGYVDPMRGLMTTEDAGQNWHVFTSNRLELEFAPSSQATAVRPKAISAEGNQLVIDLGDGRHAWLSRAGKVGLAPVRPEPVARNPSAFVRAWDHGPLGAWPIQLAVTSGALFSRDIAVVMARGRLAKVSLRDGSVLESRPVDLDESSICRALEYERHTFFHCRSATATSVYLLAPDGLVHRLAHLVGSRDAVAASNAGVVLRGSCSPDATLSSLCLIRPTAAPRTLEPSPHPSSTAKIALLESARVAVLTTPRDTRSGTLAFADSMDKGVSLIAPPEATATQKRIATQGFWHDAIYVSGDSLSCFVTHGDDLMGVRIAADGQMTFGEPITGASRAVTVANRVLVPDSSGFALESLDGGMNYLRPRLPIALGPAHREIVQRYGCSLVGCQLGDWLRVGWSDREVPGDDGLVALDAPKAAFVPPRRRRMPRLSCTLARGTPSAPRSASAGTSERRGSLVTERRHAKDELKSTVFSSFYGSNPPALETKGLGLDRGWRDERWSLHAYVQTSPQQDSSDWALDVRFFDPLRGGTPWKAHRSRIRFDSTESAARSFAHPRYGEHASHWLVNADRGGDGALWTIEDAGQTRAFLLERDRPARELTSICGRTPRRISDVVRLPDAWYFLGTEPNPRLCSYFNGESRLVSDVDPRARLGSARLRLVRNREGTRIGYWVTSARLQTLDIEWFVYPLQAKSRSIEAPIVIPLGNGIRECNGSEDGWLLETTLDMIADIESPRDLQIAARTNAQVRATEYGICIERVLVHGAHPRPNVSSGAPSKPGAHIVGNHLDELGVVRPIECQIVDSGAT